MSIYGRVSGIVCISLLAFAPVVSAAPLPIDTDFEAPDYSIGDLNGQQGWTTVNTATVSSDAAAAHEGSQGLHITSSSQAIYPADPNSLSVVWVDGYCKAEPVNFYPELPAPTSVTCFLFFHATDGIVCLDGDGAGSGTWRVTGQGASAWTRLGVRQDYGSSTWDLYVNGSAVLRNLGNAYDSAGFSRFEAQAGEAGPMYLDSFYASQQPPWVEFDTEQGILVSSDGQAGIYLYNYSTAFADWQEGTGSFTVDYDMAEEQWVGLFLYDYASAGYVHGAYVYRYRY